MKGAKVAGVLAVVYIGAVTAGKLFKYFSVNLKRKSILTKYRKQLVPSNEQLQTIKRDFIAQLENGLKQEIKPNGRHMLMLPTYVTQLPDGSETGDVYAIDLGGTNFRVMHVQLSKDRSKVESQTTHEVAIPKEVYTGTGDQLFGFLANTLKDFITKHDSGSGAAEAGAAPPVVGFCFSFPSAQTALDKGVLVDWTKGFTCTGVVGKDPVALLSAALEAAGQPCHIAALLNDTVGVMAAHRYLEPSTRVGVIIGTGTNACYVEKAERMAKWTNRPAGLPKDCETAVNIEWGAFYSEALPRCAEDEEVDKATPHAGKYLFEKLVSGMFLGEVARRVLLQVNADTQLLGDFGRDVSAARVMGALATPGSFTTAHLAAVVEDGDRMLQGTAAVLQEALGAGPQHAPYSSRRVVREVCEMVTLRSAKLVASALDALLTHTGWKARAAEQPEDVTIAFDGGVYEKFSVYRTMLDRAMRELLGPQLHPQVKMQLSHDGSCLGAAVLAAAAAR